MKSLLIAFVVLTLLVAYFREPLTRLVRGNQLPYELIESEEDFQDALAKRNAFVFVKADWSPDFAFAQREVDELAVDWTWSGRKPSVSFYLIDVTESELQPMVFRWSKSDENLKGIHGVCGSAIWLRDGKVLKRLDGWQNTQVDLTELTKELFVD